MDWSTLISSFILLTMAEIGDKTQLAVVTLS
ncbi:TMEM165/GDT1 family protein, partial [Candidatus Bathyarchaeota archaeon]